MSGITLTDEEVAALRSILARQTVLEGLVSELVFDLDSVRELTQELLLKLETDRDKPPPLFAKGDLYKVVSGPRYISYTPTGLQELLPVPFAKIGDFVDIASDGPPGHDGDVLVSARGVWGGTFWVQFSDLEKQ